MATATALRPVAHPAHPEFTVEPLHVDVETATTVVCDALPGVSATATAEGVKVRTTGGTLLAILTGDQPQAPGVELHYRVAPASDTATRKARKLHEALAAYAD